MHDKIKSSKSVKSQIFLLANLVVIHSSLDGKERIEAPKLAASFVFYDHGYRSVSGVIELSGMWSARLETAFESGSDTRPLKARHKGSVAYTNQLEAEHPGYIHELYRYAERTLGNQACYEDLAKCMNARSRIPGEDRPNTKFNKDYLRKWFMKQGGQEKSPIKKPYLSKEQKQERKKWSKREKARLLRMGKKFYACFLDEKWFYTTSRRRKIKVLPPAPHENPEEVRLAVPTTVNRQMS